MKELLPFERGSSTGSFAKIMTKYLETLLDAAEAVLSVFAFYRIILGFDKRSKHWWDEISTA